MESLATLHPNALGLPVLSLLIFLPVVGACMLAAIKDEKTCKLFSLALTVVVLLLSLPLYFAFDPNLLGFQFTEQKIWLPQYGLSYLLGIDGISLPLVLLTTFFGPIIILCSWNYITKRVRAFLACILLTQGIMVGVFVALDLILFYFFWEAMLVPMFLLIGVWGGPRRIYASIKFVLYTLAGSVFLLLAIVGLYLKAGTFSYPAMLALELSRRFEFWLFIGFLVGFAVKVPMFPVHTWLPAAHVEAPTAGSVILASILLKMGTYGLLRFNMALAPEATVMLSPIILVLSVIAIIYGGALSLAQKDMKKLIAYSSVAHMGFVTLGLLVLNLQGAQGAMLQMINHGLTTGGLFLLVGMLYERTHSRDLTENSGLARLMPGFVFFLGLFSLSSMAFPGTASFVGEFLCLVAGFKYSYTLGFWLIPGALLAAAYMFRMFLMLVWGKGGDVSHAKDISLREWVCLAPPAVLVIVFGFYPAPILKIMNPAIETILSRIPADAPTTLISLFEQTLTTWIN